MALFIQSANVLVSRVAAWVGAIPQSTGLTVSSYADGVITTSANPTSAIVVGDFIGNSAIGSFAAVIDVTSTTVTVDDPDGIWTGVSSGAAILKLPTQSSVEIVSSIQFCELKMRTLELPALRSDPYDSVNPSTITTDSNGLATIPADMNWPILFWQETPNSTVEPGSPGAGMGPWIMYDRVGDREIIRRRMIDQLYVRPFGVPRVIRASFSEVGGKYVFTPNPGGNVTMKAYYIKTYPFLFGATGDTARPFVQNNAVLATFPEGYFYGTLESYYDKNKNTAEAQKWGARMDESYGLIEDQNFKDKWSGGDRHLTSEFQPRDYRYSFK
jgi:hypothetical protein